MIFLLFLLSLPIFAQTNTGVRYVTTAPSGSCNARAQLTEKTPDGDLYTCASGTWRKTASGSSGGAPPAGPAGDWQTNGGGGMFGAFTPGAGVQTFAVTPSSANLLSALTTKTGTGLAVFGTGPTIDLTNATGLPGALVCGALTLTGNVTTSAGCATTIAAAAVTNAMLAGSIAPSKITGTAAILGANTFTGGQTAPSFIGNGADPFINLPSNTGHSFSSGDLVNNAGALQFNTGSATVPVGLLTTTTQGGIEAINSGALAQDASLFFWDFTNHCLVVGANTSNCGGQKFLLQSSGDAYQIFNTTGGDNYAGFRFRESGNDIWTFVKGRNTSDARNFIISRFNSSGTFQDNPITIVNSNGQVSFADTTMHTGLATFNGAITTSSSAALQETLSTTNSSTFVTIQRMTGGSLTAGQQLSSNIGFAASSKNEASTGFTYQSSGSNSNSYDIGFNGTNRFMSVFASGNTSFGSNPTDAGYKFDVQSGVSRFVHVAGGSSAPAPSSCGGSPSVAGTDFAGTITEGSVATGCVVTFATAYTTAPHCSVDSESGLQFSYVISTTAITITNIGALSGTLIDYVCAQ